MKPYGPFDAVGAIALEIERMSGFAQGQADFAAGKVEIFENRLPPMEDARSNGYIDGWLSAQVAFYKSLTRKTEEV